MELSSYKKKNGTLIKKSLKKLKLDTHFLKSSMIIFAIRFTIIFLVMYISINVFARILITFYFVVKSFFYRKIQLMASAPDDSVLLSDQDTN